MKLFLKFAFAIVMLVSASAASARDVYYAAKSDTARYFIEMETLRDMGNGVYSAWVFTVFTGAGVKIGIKADQYLHYHDCTRHLYDLRAHETYSWDGAHLTLIDRGSLPAYEPFDFTAVPPATLAEDIHHAICGARDPKNILSVGSLDDLVAAIDRVEARSSQ